MMFDFKSVYLVKNIFQVYKCLVNYRPSFFFYMYVFFANFPFIMD